MYIEKEGDGRGEGGGLKRNWRLRFDLYNIHIYSERQSGEGAGCSGRGGPEEELAVEIRLFNDIHIGAVDHAALPRT
jgi:hypothetical protein